MSVTAEGVETDEQLLLLQSDRCEEVQGYLMSRPLSTEDADAIAGTQGAAPIGDPRPASREVARAVKSFS